MKNESLLHLCPDFYTLPVNNPLGTTERFIEISPKYIIDYLTEKAWRKFVFQPTAWPEALERVSILNACGYKGWHIPSEEILATLIGIDPTQKPFDFSLIESAPIWTSTSCAENLTSARVLKRNLKFGELPKTTKCNYLICRDIELDEIKAGMPKIKAEAQSTRTTIVLSGEGSFTERKEAAAKLQNALNELIK